MGNQRHTQLFDLKEDPLELHNLADDSRYAEQRSRLEKTLAESYRQLRPREHKAS